jgi:pre-mRNA-splicing factor CDC5/CEF1
MAEARNLRNMTAQQTPLLGDENTPMHGVAGGTGFEGATPRHQVSATPNPLATPYRERDVGATPRSEMGASTAYGATPMRTPMRDNLSINEAGPSYGDTPREQRMRENAAKRALRQGFASLPAPENNFEFDEEVLEEEEEPEVELSEEDAAERDAKLAAARAEEERKELERRSAVVKLGLPRPVRVNLQRLVDELAATSAQGHPELAEVDQIIDYELAQLMLHDAIAHPLPGSNIPGGTVSQYDMPEDEYIAAAKDEIHRELGSTLGLPGASSDQLKQVIGTWAADGDQFKGGWVTEKEELAYSVSQGQWVDASQLSEDERIHSMAAQVDALRERMVAEAATAGKAEKRLAKQLGGYQMVNGKIKARIAAAMDTLASQKQELETFTMLRIIEEAAGPKRLEDKREEVSKLESRERDLQSQHAEMLDERKALEGEIAQVGLLEPLRVTLALADFCGDVSHHSARRGQDGGRGTTGSG